MEKRFENNQIVENLSEDSEKQALLETTKRGLIRLLKIKYDYEIILSDWRELIPIIKETIDYQFEMQQQVQNMSNKQVDWGKTQGFIDHSFIASWVGEVFMRWLLINFKIQNPKQYLKKTPIKEVKELLEAGK